MGQDPADITFRGRSHRQDVDVLFRRIRLGGTEADKDGSGSIVLIVLHKQYKLLSCIENVHTPEYKTE